MNLETVVSRNPEVVARQLGGSEGAVLLHLGSGAYHRLNELGFAVWELIDDERTVGELVEAIRARVADPPASIEQDVVRFLEGALGRDLLKASGSPPAD